MLAHCTLPLPFACTYLTIVQRIIVARTNSQCNLCVWVKMLMPRKRKMMQSLRMEKMTMGDL